jgi:hypothetical protein
MTTYSPVTDILANGEWVRDGLIWRWVQNQPEPEEADPPTYQPHDLIACPTCHARMDEHCKRKSGRQNEHSTRLVKRVCVCGGPVRPREPMCGWCRAEAERKAA